MTLTLFDELGVEDMMYENVVRHRTPHPQGYVRVDDAGTRTTHLYPSTPAVEWQSESGEKITDELMLTATFFGIVRNMDMVVITADLRMEPKVKLVRYTTKGAPFVDVFTRQEM